MKQKTLTEQFRIQSFQTDMNARLRPAALLEIMQEMAGAHAETLGIGRAMLLEKGLVWVLTRLEVRMDRWPAFGERLTVETYPMPNRRWFFPRSFLFRDEAGRQIGCAGSLWVLLDVHERRMSRPDPVLSLMPDNSDLTAPIGMPATVGECSGEPVITEHLPVYTDLDMNGHVNNTRYVDWCCNALGYDVLRDQELANFSVNFNQEILPSQHVQMQLRREGSLFSFSGFIGAERHFDVGGTLRPIP